MTTFLIIAPVVALAAAAFVAGYARGWNHGFMKASGLNAALDELRAAMREADR